MKIAIVGQNFPPLVNGQATFTHDLAIGLSALGHEVLVACPSAAPRHSSSRVGSVRVERLAGLPLTRRSPRVPLVVRPGPRLHQLFDTFEPDVVHLQDHFPLCRSALAEALRRDDPIVATNHFVPRNFTAYAPLRSAARTLVEAALWRSTWAVFRRANVVTAPTETALALLRTHGIRTQGCAISCGVDLSRFRPLAPTRRAEVRASLGLPPGAFVALYVGRLDPEKRVDVLVEAMARLQQPAIQLLVAGRGVREREITRLRDGLELGGCVRMLGFVPEPRLAELFGAADVFVMPSEAELQSIATLEALAAGLPVIAADALALPELIRPGVNGELFQPGDPADLARNLDQLAIDPERRRRMAAASLTAARAHDQRLTVARYAALYEEVSSGARLRSGHARPR